MSNARAWLEAGHAIERGAVGSRYRIVIYPPSYGGKPADGTYEVWLWVPDAPNYQPDQPWQPTRRINFTNLDELASLANLDLPDWQVF